jgi:hypothetical protein
MSCKDLLEDIVIAYLWNFFEENICEDVLEDILDDLRISSRLITGTYLLDLSLNRG